MESSSNPHHDESGFTLLETIIAMTIMVLAFASIISVEDGGITAAERTRQMNTVSMLARNKMVELEYAIQGKAFDEVKKEDAGTFDDPFKDFKWKTEVKEIKFPNLIAAATAAAGAQTGGTGAQSTNTDMMDMVGKLVTNFLSKSLREINVTITWSRGKTDQTFSVSTYWVDLNHEFELQE